MPPRCGQTGDEVRSKPSTLLRASLCQGTPPTTPCPSDGSSTLVRCVTQPLARLKPTSRLDCNAVVTPASSCGRQLAKARAQSIRPPRICELIESAAATPLVMPHLSKPVAT